jgi:uncharacterized protein (DUF1501 family)
MFLKSAVGAASLVSLSSTVPAFLTRAALAADRAGGQGETALVVVQLTGGNDGLNTVAPYENDIYARARPTLRLTARQVLKLDDQSGLHPELKAFKQLYDEGLASIIQGVGYANNDRNHGGAMRDWYTAEPGNVGGQTGWLGRAADRLSAAPTAEMPAIFVGEIGQPLGVRGERVLVPAIRSAEQLALPADPAADQYRRQLLDSAGQQRRGESDLLRTVRQHTAAALVAGERVEKVIRADSAAGDYPAYTLAERLRTIAQLLRADLGVRILFTDLGGADPGGFDTHTMQANNHGALLRELAESLAAFVADLRRGGLFDRVLVLTFSEFGRTLTESGRHGTNHGNAQPLLVVGNKLRGGLWGKQPNLAELVEDAPHHEVDFRRVYATVVEKWLGLPRAGIVDSQYEPLDDVLA